MAYPAKKMAVDVVKGLRVPVARIVMLAEVNVEGGRSSRAMLKLVVVLNTSIGSLESLVGQNTIEHEEDPLTR